MLHHMNRAAAGGIRDPYFGYVTLLLHGDGTNGAQNNTFIDSSTNNFTITRNGNTTQGAFSPYGMLWSNYFDGTGDYLNTSSNGWTQLSTGDFTLEAWCYINSYGSYFPIFEARSTATGSAWAFGVTSSGFLDFLYSASRITDNVAVGLNSWVHLATVRNGSTITLYVNGTSRATVNYALAINGSNTNPRIGGIVDPVSANGYISNARVVIGTAVYTSNFTPSAAPLTAITNTSLLTCQSNRFIDNSSNNFTITRNGDVSVQPFSPFNPTLPYSTDMNGGSGYFDGTGDYLTTPSITLGTSDFTFEAWIYRTATKANETVFASTTNGGFSVGFELSGTQVQISLRGTAYIAQRATTVPFNQWFHLAVSKASNVYRIFINGAQLGTTATNSTSIPARNYGIGISVGGTDEITGYISNLRLVIGTAVYTANFTPPTAPLTAITNTQLLTNFTNAAIFDNSDINDLETVGNAQISTSVKRFGTGSISFDGTGDWLTAPDNINLRLGTGNFTIELWVYRNASGTYGLVGKGTGTTGWLVSLNSSNQVVFTFGSSTITSTGTVAATTWTNITVVREGTGTNQTKIYINGTNDGTGTVSTDFNQTNILYVGADRTGGSNFNGYIDELRITKGIARYTANFTPSQQPFPNR